MEAALPDDRLAGRYVLQEIIGPSGVTEVWRARDLVLARPVAVKILTSDRARDPAFQRRFLGGASAAARLTHPGIVQVFDAGVHDGAAFVVVESAAGESLRTLLDRTGPFPPGVSARIMVQILEALGYAHDHGVLHQGLGTDVVLVTPGRRTKVADFAMSPAAFGLPVFAGRADHGLAGPPCVSPEQHAGSPATVRSDLYAAGAVLYEMLTSRPPLEAPDGETDPGGGPLPGPNSPGAVRGGIPRALDDVVVRALAGRPADRFATAHAMRAALEPFAVARAGEVAGDGQAGAFRTGVHAPDRAPTANLPTNAAHPPQAPPRRRGRGPTSTVRSWMLVPLLVLAVAAAAIGAGLALGRLQIGVTSGRGGSGPAVKSTRSAIPIPIVRAEDFDPFGNDGREHPQQAPLALDSNTGTAWTTDHYTTAAFGNLKTGVGLWLDLGRDRDVRRITITSSVPGWTFQVRSGPPPSPSTSLDAYSQPRASLDGTSEFTVGPSGTATVDLRPFPTAGVLIWITRLAPDGGGYAASIVEASLVGRAP